MFPNRGYVIVDETYTFAQSSFSRYGYSWQTATAPMKSTSKMTFVRSRVPICERAARKSSR